MSFSAASLRAVLDAHAPVGATGLVVALSGGADSVSLLAVAMDTRFRGLPLRAIHIDHGLQPAAFSFKEACVALCTGLKIPLTVIPVVVKNSAGLSLEAAAREARYAALAGELQPGECLLTAHHREDQAETVLLQSLRGAGLKGMSAMPIRRDLGKGWHLRPVLNVSQSDLLAYGAHLSGACVTDPMNTDQHFDRGYLRHAISPLINARWPGASQALARGARHMAEAQMLLESVAAADVRLLRDGDALSLPGLRALIPERRINALREWLSAAGAEPPSTARLTEALRQMLDSQIDHLPCISWGHWALRRYRQRVFLTPMPLPRLAEASEWLGADSRAELGPHLGALRLVAQTGGIDPACLAKKLSIRRRRGGETLKPGIKAKTHTLQHLCQSYGVLPWLREALPLVFANDVLIAVADLWFDARYCVAQDEPGVAIIWEQGPIIV